MTVFLFANGLAKGHGLTSIHRVKCEFKNMSEQFAGCFSIIWQRTHEDFLYYFIFLETLCAANSEPLIVRILKFLFGKFAKMVPRSSGKVSLHFQTTPVSFPTDGIKGLGIFSCISDKANQNQALIFRGLITDNCS